MLVRDDSPNVEPHYRARFYFNPNSIAMASGDNITLFQGLDAGGQLMLTTLVENWPGHKDGVLGPDLSRFPSEKQFISHATLAPRVAKSGIRPVKKKKRNSASTRVAAALRELASDPRPAGCKKLVNAGAWRVRVGDYRIIYDIDDAARVVRVVRIRPRGSA